MHAMPSSSATRRRRLTFKRIFLALVLGLVTWWGVGWWLSPRPLYTLKYPDRGWIDARHRVLLFPSMPASTEADT
jgi:hypothetical protein